MRLNDRQIKELGIIHPFDEKYLQSHSYDCTLGDVIKIQSDQKDVWHNISLGTNFIAFGVKEFTGYMLRPGQFILASTREYLQMPSNVEGYVQGKSSLGRGGLQIECAGFIDPLFQGEITLEIFNMGRWDYHLVTGMPIAQLLFTNVTPAEIKPYDKCGKYNNQRGPTEPRP